MKHAFCSRFAAYSLTMEYSVARKAAIITNNCRESFSFCREVILFAVTVVGHRRGPLYAVSNL